MSSVWEVYLGCAWTHGKCFLFFVEGIKKSSSLGLGLPSLSIQCNNMWGGIDYFKNSIYEESFIALKSHFVRVSPKNHNLPGYVNWFVSRKWVNDSIYNDVIISLKV